MVKTHTRALPSRVRIGKSYIGPNDPVFFIAEIGNNHNGDYFLARKTIEAAANADADAVKFQKRFIDEVFTKEMQERPQVKDQIYGKTYGEYRKSLELDEDEFCKLKKVSEDLGLIFFATPFDTKSVDFLERVGVDVYKISSFDVTNLPLLDYVARKEKPIILSVGMSDLAEVDEAVETILCHNNQLVLKHCVAIYPAPDELLNLNVISTLKERFYPLPVGYSGHEKDILPSLAAVVLGARSIERHFTLDKSLPGPDHGTVSLEPAEFKHMVDETRRLERVLGNAEKKLLDAEQKAREKHTKSLVTTQAVKKGAVFTKAMLTVKSPGHGLKPNRAADIIGKRAAVAIPKDTVIESDFIKWK